MNSETYRVMLVAMAHALPWTLLITLASFICGALLAIPLCACRVSRFAWVRGVSLALVLLVRSIPPIVWLFFIFFGIGGELLPPSPLVASILGLALIGAANLAEVYQGALKAVPYGQFEAARVLGLSRLHQYLDVLGPQVLRVALPSATTFAIVLLKDSAIASTIGVAEIASAAYHVSQQTFLGIEVYMVAGALYLAISVGIAALSRSMDQRLRLRVARSHRGTLMPVAATLQESMQPVRNGEVPWRPQI